MTEMLEIALAYIRRGWSPIPIPHKSKRPLLDDWPNLRITEETAPRWFNGEAQNVGIQLGSRSGGLTDGDLDCQEAVVAAPYLMPGTAAIFGRASKRFSHRLYKTTLADAQERATIQFKDTQKPPQVILEIRIGAEGEHAAQTIFPGSNTPKRRAGRVGGQRGPRRCRWPRAVGRSRPRRRVRAARAGLPAARRPA